MRTKNLDMARLRQICSLGLPSQVLAPQICEEMRQLILADRVHLAWSDRLGNIVDGFFEKPDAGALDYFKHHSPEFQEDAGLSYRHALLFGKETGNFRWPFKKGFESTASHRALFGNLGLRHCIDGVIRDDYGPLGQIFLLRRVGDPDFSDFEEAQLARALPHIAHAMSNARLTSDSFVESGDSGMMIFGQDGTLTHQSEKAKALCFYALDEGGGGTAWDDKYGREQVAAALLRLFDQVVGSIGSADDGSGPPSWRISNSWGEFQIRAYRLAGTADAHPSYGVLLEKMIPMRVRLLERVKSFPLSNREREVCFLLALGIETPEVSAMLNMARSTLKDHAKSIYQKVGVANRKELLQALMR
jgi:DNA-binding CsgD family transcriptional regulator